MSQMDFSQEKVQAQFNELGLKPEDVIQKVLATPDLAAGFSNPKVQQAIFDISQNPMVSSVCIRRIETQLPAVVHMLLGQAGKGCEGRSVWVESRHT